ncbi:MAG TPA: hypothetical protein VK066_21955 [Chloroflexota bacterium]|nr:hypothetical protein [Chloroflexota bacterium]
MLGRLIGATLAILAALTLLVGQPQRVLADPRDFTLVNGSSITIREVYVSASDVQSWEEDVLGTDVLPPGQQVNITFSPADGDAGKCLYDIRVVGVNGAEGTMTGVNLCTTTTVTFS